MSSQMISVKDVAETLGCNERTIRESIENKTFPFGICFKSRSGQKIYKISATAFNNWLSGKEA